MAPDELEPLGGTPAAADPGIPALGLARLFTRFLRFGALAWGGPVAQIAMLRAELVDRERWITSERFNRTLAVYQALPGPEAHELCVYFGMLAHGRLGGLVAGLGFMLPGMILVLVLAWTYVRVGASVGILAGVLAGLQPAVAAMIARAVVRIGRHILTHPWLWLIAGTTGAAQFAGTPFWVPIVFGGASAALWSRGFRVSAVLALLFAGATVAVTGGGDAASLAAGSGQPPSLAQLAATGARAGLLTFGGAYAAIPFLRRDTVVDGGWLTNEGFVDALALSGAVPAPLVIFGTFIGYLGAGLDGALIITGAIFAPAFLFTLVGHSRLERLVDDQRFHSFLDGVAAAVVGMMAVTAVRLLPVAIPDAPAAVIAAATLVALVTLKARWAVAAIMACAGALGLLVTQLR